jgi:hypothetical protein
MEKMQDYAEAPEDDKTELLDESEQVNKAESDAKEGF